MKSSRKNRTPLSVAAIHAAALELIEKNGFEALSMRSLAAALGVDADTLTRKLTQRADKEFVYLKRRINPAEARRILALDIPGVFSKREYRRFYPQGEAIAHVLGFTNIDDRGQEGLELAFEDTLRGSAGMKRVIRDRRGRTVEEVDLVRAAEPGKNITLTIDRRIQFLAYRELRRALLDSGATSGSAVVLDVATGEVLAMANLPSFNPNAVGLGNRDAHRNRAVTDLIEPGSTMKPLTVAAALESGAITVQSVFNTSPGWIANGKYRTTDTHNYGVLDTTGIITKSSNVGAAKIVHLLPSRDFYDFLVRFGYGRSTGSGFPGENPGRLRKPERWDGTTKQTLSYGYGLTGDRRARGSSTAQTHGQCRAGLKGNLRPDRRRAWRLGLPLPPHVSHAWWDDADRDRARWNRDPGRHFGLSRRWQDRHRAQSQQRRLFAPLFCVLRRPGAGGQSPLFNGGGDRRSGSRTRLLRRRGVRAGVQERDGRRAAVDGRGAGRHRHVARRAGRCGCEAQSSVGCCACSACSADFADAVHAGRIGRSD